MKILITGGAGYLGSSLLKVLLDDESIKKVIVFENFTFGTKNIFRGIHNDKLSVLEGDLLNSLDVEYGLRKIDVIIHLGAISHTPLSSGSEKDIIKVNSWGTENIIKAAIKYNVKKIIFTSTISINGATDQNGVVFQDNSVFSRSKRISEDLLLEAYAKKKLDIEIIRLGTLFGLSPYMNFITFVNKMAFDAAIDRRLVILGDGAQKRVVTSIQSARKQIFELIFNETDNKINEVYDTITSPNQIGNIITTKYPHVNLYYTDQDSLTRFSFLPQKIKENTLEEKSNFMNNIIDIVEDLKLWK